MSRLLYWSSSVGVALAIAVTSSWMAVGRTGIGGGSQTGPWVVEAAVGSVDAGMYTRARTSIQALMGLQKKEALYYVATRDDTGAPLDGTCTYHLRGSDPAARWWSITAYGADHFLIPNAAQVFSSGRTTVARGPGGDFLMVVSADPHPGNWIPVRRGERFDLMARLYGPAPDVSLNPAAVALPSIMREGCR